MVDIGYKRADYINMEIQQIIEKLGGARKVGETIGITDHAVYKWVYRGKIPARSRRDLLREYGKVAHDLFGADQPV